MERIYCDKKLCTGCSACYAVCPVGCIEMLPDGKGFLYPSIDEEKCVHCGKCKSACQTYIEEKSAYTPELYGYVNPDTETLLKSSSGGIFSALTEKILAKGGYVCGAVFDEKISVRHIVTNDAEDIRKMRGSKYVQSRMENCFSEILRLLDSGKTVLFTGTPCQVLGLKCFLKKDYGNLFTVDCVCHSIPSPLIFSKYIQSIERVDGKIIDFSFRNKKDGWNNYNLYYKTCVGEKYLPHKGNYYMEGFLDGLYNRESCNSCPVKTRAGYASDITIGDYWHAKELTPEIYNENGVSAVLVNSVKGKELLRGIPIKKYEIEAFLNVNKKYSECAKTGVKSDLFWLEFNKNGIDAAYKKAYKLPFKIKIKTVIKKITGGTR